MKTLPYITTIACLLAATAHAAEANKEKDVFQRIADLTEVDITVPSSPAASILGLSSEKIQRPGTTRDFAGSIIRALGTDGKVVNAIAVDISPASLFFRKFVTGGSEYSNPSKSDFNFTNWPTRVLARTTVSLGTTEADSTGASKTALGIRVGLIDNGDPGLFADDVAKCLASEQMPTLPAGKNLDDGKSEIDFCNPAKNKKLALWARPALYAGFGKAWYSRSGRISDSSSAAKAVWLTYSQGFAASDTATDSGYRTLLQVYLAKRIDDRYVREAAPNVLLIQDSTEGIVRLRSGREKWHAYVELGHRKVKTDGSVDEKIRHVAFGLEKKLEFADDMWLQIGSIRERGFVGDVDKTAITTNLRIGAAFLNLPAAK